MSENPLETGWYLHFGMRRYWNGHAWHLAGQFLLDPGGDLPPWPSDCDMPDVVANATRTLGVDEDRITTLQSLPGYRIVAVLGVVTELSATSGWTATSKGNTALNMAMNALRATARTQFGANAIVGLSASMFGAAGGITSAFGGDAVGVLLTGTAVTVTPDDGTNFGPG